MSNTAQSTVMVAEDYDDTRLMIRQVLERQGYRVLEARNGMEAVELARHERPGLILMDINLPLIDGVNATRRIRELEGLNDVPIVAVSAYDSPELRDSALATGCREYLTKPIDADRLKDLIDRWLPRRKSASERKGSTGETDRFVESAPGFTKAFRKTTDG